MGYTYTKRSFCFSFKFNWAASSLFFFKLIMSEVLDLQKNHDNSTEFPHTSQPVPFLIVSYIYMLPLLQLVSHW